MLNQHRQTLLLLLPVKNVSSTDWNVEGAPPKGPNLTGTWAQCDAGRTSLWAASSAAGAAAGAGAVAVVDPTGGGDGGACVAAVSAGARAGVSAVAVVADPPVVACAVVVPPARGLSLVVEVVPSGTVAGVVFWGPLADDMSPGLGAVWIGGMGSRGYDAARDTERICGLERRLWFLRLCK